MSEGIRSLFSKVSLDATIAVLGMALVGLGVPGYIWSQIKSVAIESLVVFAVPMALFLASEIYRLIQRPKWVKAAAMARSSVVLIIVYTVSWSIFFLLPNQSYVANSTASIISVIILLGGIVVRGIYERDGVNRARLPDKVGYSVSGVVVEKQSTASEFILIHNLNLRGGEGLWVPPGGHYDPRSTEPFDALRQKLIQEIGFECSNISPLPELDAKVRDHDTSLAKAFASPLFYLRENLQGVCKDNHSVHVAAVFACKVDRPVLVGGEKYKAAEQIRVPVARCLQSTQSAREAVCEAVSNWSFRKSGVRPGNYPDVPDDVPWRLHVVSKMLQDNGIV